MFRFISAFILLGVIFSSALEAKGVLRDAEFEHALDELARPIFNVARLPADQYSIIIVNDASPNAFVLGSKYVFVHKGLILRCNSAPMLQAVLAHEIAHLASHHVLHRSDALRNASSGALIGLALGVLLEAAAGSEFSGIGSGAAIGLNSAAQRNFFAHTRAEEKSADQLGAAYMKKAGIPLQGLVDVMSLFEGQEGLSVSSQDAYVRTHPLSRDRVRTARTLAQGDKKTKASANSVFWFERLQAGLAAYDGRRAPNGISKSAKAYYQAMRASRKGDTQKAISLFTQLLQQRPNDAYLKIRKGEAYLAAGQAKAALKEFRSALSQKEDPVTLHYAGRAAFVAGQHKTALSYFEKARRRDSLNPRLLRDMALAYGRLGENGKAALATAESYAARNRPKDAQLQAKRAQNLLAKNSPAWQRAQDIADAAEKALAKKK